MKLQLWRQTEKPKLCAWLSKCERSYETRHNRILPRGQQHFSPLLTENCSIIPGQLSALWNSFWDNYDSGLSSLCNRRIGERMWFAYDFACKIFHWKLKGKWENRYRWMPCGMCGGSISFNEYTIFPQISCELRYFFAAIPLRFVFVVEKMPIPTRTGGIVVHCDR